MPTIGVALSIPEPWGRQLRDYRMSIGDDEAEQIPTHITLLPPMAVTDEAFPAIQRHLAAAAAEIQPFRVRLRGTGTFRPVSPVVFVSVAEGISDCEALEDVVRRGPLALDRMFPYHPHVTVAHHLDEATMDRAFEELADFGCVFRSECFHLYVHDAEQGWQSNQEFALG